MQKSDGASARRSKFSEPGLAIIDQLDRDIARRDEKSKATCKRDRLVLELAGLRKGRRHTWLQIELRTGLSSREAKRLYEALFDALSDKTPTTRANKNRQERALAAFADVLRDGIEKTAKRIKTDLAHWRSGMELEKSVAALEAFNATYEAVQKKRRRLRF